MQFIEALHSFLIVIFPTHNFWLLPKNIGSAPTRCSWRVGEVLCTQAEYVRTEPLGSGDASLPPNKEMSGLVRIVAGRHVPQERVEVPDLVNVESSVAVQENFFQPVAI